MDGQQRCTRNQGPGKRGAGRDCVDGHHRALPARAADGLELEYLAGIEALQRLEPGPVRIGLVGVRSVGRRINASHVIVALDVLREQTASLAGIDLDRAPPTLTVWLASTGSDTRPTRTSPSKTIARYVTKTPGEYTRLLDRFFEMVGKRDPTTQQFIGYRTRIIHIGEKLDAVVPRYTDRLALFEELDGYIRPVIDHMIEHSFFNWDEYSSLRQAMRPFDS
jgi:hypothetical protein